MINKIIHTLGSRLIMAVFNLLLLLVTTRWMGAEVKGMVSLLVLNMSISTMVTGLLGGPALVYLSPRHRKAHLLTINYAWSVLSSGLLTLLFVSADLEMGVGTGRFFRMALMEGLVATNLMLLLGAERVAWHNILQVAKAGMVLLATYAWVMYGHVDFDAFAWAYEASLGASLVASVVAVWKTTSNGSEEKTFRQCLRDMWHYGRLVQIGNSAQLLTYRLSYFFMEMLIQPNAYALVRIGIFSTAVQLGEALWQFPKSVAVVQYSAISNMNDEARALRISLQIARINYGITAVGVLLLLLLPASFYGAVFGPDFKEVPQFIAWMVPGIIALAFSNGTSHFFAGIGKLRYNTVTSLTGLGLTIAIGLPAVYLMEARGAALTASVVYGLQAFVQIFFLRKHYRINLRDFLINADDVRGIAAQIRRILDRVK